MTLDWDDLRVFLAVAREGNLSAAARALRVSQPTVGRRLRMLEASLQARLFDRLPDGFVPTQAGAELVPLAEAMEHTADTVSRRQASFADSVRGTVRLSIGEVMAQFVTDHVAELRERLPEVEIELSVAHIYANLSRREADLLLRECLPDNPGLVARGLGRFAFAVYCGRSYLDAHPAARHETGRFRDCQWVGFDEDHSYFMGQRWLLERLDGGVPAIRVNDAMVLHDAVRKGAGLGVLPCFAADADPMLVRLTPPLPEATSAQYALMHRDLKRSPSVRAVLDALVDIFKREAPRLEGRTAQERLSA
jgi:DNA-binding transcriptional LysR family regulator